MTQNGQQKNFGLKNLIQDLITTAEMTNHAPTTNLVLLFLPCPPISLSVCQSLLTVDELVPLLTDKILPCTYKMPSDVCDNLLCGTCAAARVHRKTPGITPPNSTKEQNSIKPREIKAGDWISCDHYSSLVKGRVMSAGVVFLLTMLLDGCFINCKSHSLLATPFVGS
jgi:hypothetical protein